MKKSYIVIIVGFLSTVVLVLALYIQISSGSSNKVHDENAQITYSQSKENIVITSDGCEDENYNYISNPDVLSDFNFLISGVQSMGDNINSYLQSSGYYGNKLYVIDIHQNSSIISMKIEVGDTNSILHVDYDNMENTFKYFIQE